MNTGKFTVAQNSATTLATQIASYALNFAAGIIIARSLGPANKGTLSLVVLSHVLLLTVSNLGLAAASSFLIARRGFSLDQVGRHAVAAAICLGFATLALTAVVVNFLPASVVSPSQRVYVLLAAGLVPLALATQFLNGALVGAGQIIWLNGLTLAQAFINVAGLVLFLLVLRLGLAGGLTAWTVTVVSTCAADRRRDLLAGAAPEPSAGGRIDALEPGAGRLRGSATVFEPTRRGWSPS